MSLGDNDPAMNILLSTDDFFKKELERIDEEKQIVVNQLLRTTEIFPLKYSVIDLVDDDEEDTKPTEFTRNSAGSKSRKSGLFPNNQAPTIDRDQIMIPPNASGVVSVMGRRINVDRLVNGNASLYSMLRSWIHDDPDEAMSPISVKSVRRKTLEDYRKQRPVKEKSTNLSKISKAMPARDLSEHSKRLKASKDSFDAATKNTMKLFKQYSLKTKRTRIAVRKKRIAAARANLRRKGINV